MIAGRFRKPGATLETKPEAPAVGLEGGCHPDGEIIVGKFVDRERPQYLDSMRARLQQKLGPKYVEDHVTCQ